MSQKEIAAAARALAEEKGIDINDIVETIESALAAAYRKDYGEKNQNIKAEFDLETGKAKFFDEKTVVEDLPEEELAALAEAEEEASKQEEKTKETTDTSKGETSEKPKTEASAAEDAAGGESAEEEGEEKRRFNPRTEIQLADAKELKKTAKVGDVIRTKLEVHDDYGRMAAQTAKQVIIQRVREIERTNVYNDFKDKEHEVITGVVQRREGRIIIVDLGRVAGVIPPDGQVPGERYQSGSRIKVYVEAVNLTARGPEILLSRSSVEIVRKIFMVEIPEISNGLIDIKGIAREAGSRSKVAVVANEENVDPIGSCVGQRGTRIQTIIDELGGEKVDIIQYSEDPGEFIAHALAPAKSLNVEVDEDKHIATAHVAADQLSLAIGRGGQNVRLAARLTGWKIDIKETGSDTVEVSADEEGEVKLNEAEEPSTVEGDSVDTDEAAEETADAVDEVVAEPKEETKEAK